MTNLFAADGCERADGGAQRSPEPKKTYVPSVLLHQCSREGTREGTNSVFHIFKICVILKRFQRKASPKEKHSKDTCDDATAITHHTSEIMPLQLRDHLTMGGLPLFVV
jgi:hypothetical protein